MADRPIDQLPVKTAAQLALTDFLIGHGDGAPAAFRSELDEVLDFLGPTLVSRFSDDIVGEVVGEIGSNENGSWVRFGNGLQVCWHNYQIPASVAVNVANSGWGYRSGQQDAPLPAPFVDNVRTFAVANINTVGYFATSGATSAVQFTFHFVSGASVIVPSGASVNLLAIGRWK